MIRSGWWWGNGARGRWRMREEKPGGATSTKSLGRKNRYEGKNIDIRRIKYIILFIWKKRLNTFLLSFALASVEPVSLYIWFMVIEYHCRWPLLPCWGMFIWGHTFAVFYIVATRTFVDLLMDIKTPDRVFVFESCSCKCHYWDLGNGGAELGFDMWINLCWCVIDLI